MQKTLVMALIACFSFILAGVLILWSVQTATLWASHQTDDTSWLIIYSVAFLLVGFAFGILVSLPVIYPFEKKQKGT